MGGAKVEKMTDPEIIDIVRGWRRRHPATQRFWYAMDAAARAAIADPAGAYHVGRIGYDRADGPDGKPYLRMRLPSGRYLCYRNPTTGVAKCVACDGQGVVRPAPGAPYVPCKPCEGKGGEGTEQIGYLGTNQTTHQWGAQTTYGGKLTENATQAVARDIFFHGFHLAVQAGYRIVLRVHDELVAEVPLDSPHLTLDGLIKCMTTNPVWALDLPLAAAGFETLRYFKE
jgi:DNA polymerase